MTHVSVTIQMTPESKAAMPSWMGEVAAFAHVLTHTGMRHFHPGAGAFRSRSLWYLCEQHGIRWPSLQQKFDQKSGEAQEDADAHDILEGRFKGVLSELKQHLGKQSHFCYAHPRKRELNEEC